MATYTVAGTFTYNNKGSRDGVISAVNAVLASNPHTVVDTAFPAGITTQGNTIVNISVSMDSEAAAIAISDPILAAFNNTRYLDGYMSITRKD